jgi:Ankyrin repeats (3 copies)
MRLVLGAIPHPHATLAAACMSHLEELGFQNSKLKNQHDLMMTLLGNPLLGYAYGNWSLHVRKSLDDSGTHARLAQFIRGCEGFPVVLEVEAIGLDRFDKLEPLHMALYFDFPFSFVSELVDPNQRSHVTRISPLKLAVLRGAPGPVEELLTLPNIRVNEADEHSRTPLMYALSRKINRSIVASLFAHPDVDVNLVDGFGHTPLMHACIHDRDEATALLLSHRKIKPNLVYNELTALMHASLNGSSRAVQALLADPRVMVNVTTGYFFGETALQMAQLRANTTYHDEVKEEAYKEIVRLLKGNWEVVRYLRIPLYYMRLMLPPEK